MFSNFARFSFFVFFTSFLFLNLFNIAQAKIPLESYGNIPDTSLMTLSPSGNLIGFRKSTSDKDLYVVFSLTENKVVASIDIGNSKPAKAYFVTEENIILVAGKYQQTHGFYSTSPRNTSFALSFNIKEKKAHRLLNPGEKIYDNQVSLGRIIGISSDGEFLYMPAFTGGIAFGEWQGLDYTLMKTRLTNKRKPRAFSKGLSDTREFFVDDKDNVIARVRYDNKTNIYRIEVPQGKKWLEIYTEERKIPLDIKGVMPDRKHLIISKYLGQGSKKHKAFFSLSLTNGAISEKAIFHRNDASVDSVITDINQTVYGVKYSGFLPKYEFFDETINQRIEKVSDSFANTSINVIDWTHDWKKILVFIEGQESSGEYIIVDENNEMSIVGMARPDISYTAVHPISTFTYKASDGLKIPALMTIPKSWDNKTKLPTIMLPHDGPESHDKVSFDWMAQFFAEQGYLVIQPQFRGSDGFGKKLNRAGRGEWGGKMQSDLTDALNAVVDKGIADSTRACIVGASYGGYAALAAGAFNPDIFKCVVSINGISDLPLMFNSKKQKFGKEHWVLAYWNKVIVGKKDKELLLSTKSPINYVNDFTAPVLLLHGKNDDFVDFEQSKEMNKALKKANKNVTLITLKNDDHYLSFEETRLKTLVEIQRFIKKHI